MTITHQEIKARCIPLWGARGYQSELARRLGHKSRNMVCRYVNGRAEIPDSTGRHIRLIIESEEQNANK